MSKKAVPLHPLSNEKVYMVAIAQLAEHRIVVPSVVGSSPTSHPKKDDFGRLFFYICCVFKKKAVPLCVFR